MFAVVRTGGKQYRVALGDKIVVEKLDGEAGDKITLGDVLLAGDGGQLKSVEGLKVAAEIVAQAKADKVTVFKKRRRHNYRRKKGHRQQHTILKIVSIGDQKHVPSKAEGAEPKQPKAAKEQAPAAATAPVKTEALAKSVKPAAKAAPAAKKPHAPKADKPKAKKPKAKKPKAEKPKAEKKPAAPKSSAKPASTKNAAPAKGAAKKPTKTK
ncbi:MAG: 50S ribosomal protein L21 [Sphingomicrobium sp.]